MDINIEEIKEIARKAGQKTLEYYSKVGSVEYKTNDKSSPLTEADLASEKIILESLEKYKLPILSEESTDDKKRLDSQYIWVVDPLDGTSDFIGKTEEFSVIIGLVKDNKPVLGVVYEPISERIYFAEKDKGAFKEEKGEIEKIKVSNADDFSQTRILVSRNHLLEKEVELSDKLNLQKITCGSAGIKMSKVASGQAEIYLNSSDRTNEWDTCAGYIILQEAGGKMTDMNGEEILYNQKNPAHLKGFVATSGKKHDEIISKLQKI